MRLVNRVEGSYDVIVVGTGFAATFFLKRYLTRAAPTARVLVLERGRINSHADQVQDLKTSNIEPQTTFQRRGSLAKDWNFTIGFGGGSNCWWANTPRQHPSDFKLRSRYGVGRDWPVSYDDLEAYYGEVEEIMEISGPPTGPWPRSRPYPLPPHRVTEPDRLLMAAYPGLHVPIPTARPSQSTRTRPACCVNGVCTICPIDSKFTILNSLTEPYEDARVEVMLEAEVRALDLEGGRAKGVVYRKDGADARVGGDLVVLAAHGLFNPVILLRSGLTHPMLGRNLHEQLSAPGEVLLNGVDHFQGSTVITGLNYVLYDGPFRNTQASMLLEIWNMGTLRSEHGRWRQVLPFTMKIEDLPQTRNRIELAPGDAEPPIVTFEGFSDYTLNTFKRAKEILAKVFAPLPVEDIRLNPEHISTSSHIHGTTIMGNDPADSIVDAAQIHHQLRNVVVLGSGNFPSGSQSNPTLTICALALRTADKLGSAA